jgi:hypothetical protein
MKVGETTVVEKLLRSVSDKFLPIVSTIEQSGDVTVMSVADNGDVTDVRGRSYRVPMGVRGVFKRVTS